MLFVYNVLSVNHIQVTFLLSVSQFGKQPVSCQKVKKGKKKDFFYLFPSLFYSILISVALRDMISKMAPGYTPMMVLASTIFCHWRFLLHLVMKQTLLYYHMEEQMEMVDENKITNETKINDCHNSVYFPSCSGCGFPIQD